MFRYFLLIVNITMISNCLAQSEGEEKEVDVFIANQFYELAKSAYEEQNYQAAISLFDSAITENPNNSDYLFGRALCYYEVNQLDSASFDIEKAILYQPEQPDYHHYAGNIYFKYGDINLAITNYLKAEEYQGNNDIFINETSNFFNLGTCFLLIESYSHATIYYSKVIDFDEDYAIAYYNRGISYERLKLNSLACKDFKSASEKGIKKAASKVKALCQQ